MLKIGLLNYYVYQLVIQVLILLQQHISLLLLQMLIDMVEED